MSSKKIYLIRHGQTDFNLKGIVQGSGVDTDLNETGIKQADAFFSFYKNTPFDRVYTSALKRSVQSVQKFIDKGIDWESHAGLNEISWGNNDGKITSFAENTYYWKILESWKEGKIDEKIEGGESPLDVQLRIKPVIDLITSRKDEKNILICMHGRAIRIILATMLNYHLKCMDEFEHHNLGLYVLNYTGSMFHIEKYNCLKHLG